LHIAKLEPGSPPTGDHPKGENSQKNEKFSLRFKVSHIAKPEPGSPPTGDHPKGENSQKS